MKWTAPIDLFLKFALALWMFHIVSLSEKEVETQQRPRGGKPSEAAAA